MCDASTDWAANPGTCRLRIHNYVNGLFTPDNDGFCNLDAAGTTIWDGTFSGVSVETGFILYYYADAAFNSVSTFRLFSGHNNATFGNQAWTSIHLRSAGHWELDVFCTASGQTTSKRIWQGNLVSASPIGTYISDGGDCSFAGDAGPAAVDIEAYSP